MAEDDIDGAVSLTRFPCLIASPKGSRLVVEDDFRSMMKSHSGKDYAGIKMKNELVEILNESTAIITYEADFNGKTCLDTSTWVNENGNWLCAFHSEVEKVQ